MLTDSTLIYRGSYNRIKPSIWELGQFERNVLDCSLLLLSAVGKVAPAFRGDPVRVSRALSALVNSPDDDGAIMGNWSEDFSGMAHFYFEMMFSLNAFQLASLSIRWNCTNEMDRLRGNSATVL